MTSRLNLFLIHAWAEADTYAKAVDRLRASDVDLADYSIPPWKQVDGSDAEIERSIRSRISTASSVVVVNSEGLHRREWSGREMEIAVDLGKPIVVLQPHDNFQLALPQVLDGHVHRVTSWRGDSLARAVRGESGRDYRAFDIAEIRDRREVVKLLAGGISFISIAILAQSLYAWNKLARELASAGVEITWTSEDAATVMRLGAGGAVLGAIAAGLFSQSTAGAVLGALGGALLGSAFGTTLVYRATIHGTRDRRVITLSQA